VGCSANARRRKRKKEEKKKTKMKNNFQLPYPKFCSSLLIQSDHKNTPSFQIVIKSKLTGIFF
jgi:hypothetical protein